MKVKYHIILFGFNIFSIRNSWTRYLFFFCRIMNGYISLIVILNGKEGFFYDCKYNSVKHNLKRQRIFYTKIKLNLVVDKQK